MISSFLWVMEAKSLNRNLYSIIPSSFSRSATLSKSSCSVMVKVMVFSGLFRASTSPAAVQPMQASRMDMPITAATYSSTRAAVRPAERRFFFRGRPPEPALCSRRGVSRSPWEGCGSLRRSLGS